MRNRQTLTFCLCLAAFLAFWLSGCRSQPRSSRRAEFVNRILPNDAVAAADYAQADKPLNTSDTVDAKVEPLPDTQSTETETSQVTPVSYDLPPSPEILPPGQLAEEIVDTVVDNTVAAPAGDSHASIVGLPKGAPNDVTDEYVLDLVQVVSIAQNQNPQLGIASAEIGKAAAGKKMAFSAFLPRLGVVNSLNSADVGINKLSYSPLDPYLPVEWNSQYNQVELETQWILWDFGRRVGRYRQADILVDIAQLKYQRACQTVGYDATEAYYRVLLAYSTVVTSQNTLRRAEEYLRVAKHLFEQGQVDSESIYSAELQVAQARQQCVSARTRVNTSTAQLNLSMGRNTVCRTRVRQIDSEPRFQSNLLDCLGTAVSHRREIRVVSDWVAKAHEATAVAKADFMPKVVSGADYSSTGGDMETDAASGYIAFCWDIYAGGKRVGKVRQEQAEVDKAIANGRQVCDRVAFEVNYSYQKVDDAAERIDLARSSVRLARERLRIVMNKFEQGEDSPTDVVDAQTAMTVAEQRYFDTVFQLRSAIARLEYAMGVN